LSGTTQYGGTLLVAKPLWVKKIALVSHSVLIQRSISNSKGCKVAYGGLLNQWLLV